MKVDRRFVLAGLLAGSAVRAAQAKTASLPDPLPAPDPRFWAAPAGIASRDAFAAGPNGRVFYRSFGAGQRVPAIVLHGGPAAGLGYTMPYAHLATERTTVLYDQSGCGRSDAPTDLSRYTLDRYVDELEALRAHLGFERVVLVGHSWGGLLAPAYAARYPQAVAGLVIGGSAPRWRDFQDAADYWLAVMGPEATATVRRVEAGGRSDDPAYVALTARYYAQHLCRLKRWPAILTDAAAALSRNPVYPYLNGPTEFRFSGAFRSLDVSDALRTLAVPVLVTCGQYDEAPPWIAARYRSLVRDLRIAEFNGLSHMSHLEDPAHVLAVTRRFLASVG